ncbi:hypothetical protein PsB1_0195 [Candidatus Phycosocius spiralis]|uniref:CoA transferase n=1 Tax=Candidatus Phycosocius spiralis TaxID=2815099 RepID=A0ABQ4PSQ9_9PROT|nr:hypothetical protein PsB1_0195 [Candidatus Phycosocius spiralis]
MADWAADVIKIEPPGGDPIRQFFETIGSDISDNPVFDLDNRGKLSIIIDITQEDGRGIVRKLATQADNFITNVHPASLTKAGLAFAPLAGLNPRLIYANVTGYGLEGPDVDRAGFDIAAFWALSSWAHLTTPKDRPFPFSHWSWRPYLLYFYGGWPVGSPICTPNHWQRTPNKHLIVALSDLYIGF